MTDIRYLRSGQTGKCRIPVSVVGESRTRKLVGLPSVCALVQYEGVGASKCQWVHPKDLSLQEEQLEVVGSHGEGGEKNG